MPSLKALAHIAAAIGIQHYLLRKPLIKHSQLKTWIHDYADPNNIGRGYAGGSTPDPRWKPFVEVHRKVTGEGVIVEAFFFIERKQGPAFRQQWEGRGLDEGLAKFFGNSSRKRINI